MRYRWNNVLLLAVVVVLVVVSISVALLFRDAAYIFMFKVGLERMRRGCLRIFDAGDGRVLFEVDRKGGFVGEIYTSDFAALCKAVVKRGDIGLGEEYMRGSWASPDLFGLFKVLVDNDREMQSRSRSDTWARHDDVRNIKVHYDAGNDFYLKFLSDDLNAYTCGLYLRGDEDLNEAQYNKVDTIVRKMALDPGMRVLDIGCGWGKIIDYIGKKTKCTCDGVTISQEQVNHIAKEYPHLRVYQTSYEDLPEELNGAYDRVFSIEMFEHVRCPNYYTFMKKVWDVLKPGGLLVLQVITFGRNAFSVCGGQTNTFITEYIFPGGQIPKSEWILEAAGRADLTLVHAEVFGGHHYRKTLMTWRDNILKLEGYDDDFIRKYDFYMAECAASFDLGRLHVTQFVFAK